MSARNAAPCVVRIRSALINKDELFGLWCHERTVGAQSGAELNPKGAVQMPSRCFVILSLKPTELKASLLFTAPSARGQQLRSTQCAYQALNKAYALLVPSSSFSDWRRFSSSFHFTCDLNFSINRGTASGFLPLLASVTFVLSGNYNHMLQANPCSKFSGKLVLMPPNYVWIQVYLLFTQTFELMFSLLNGVWVWLHSAFCMHIDSQCSRFFPHVHSSEEKKKSPLTKEDLGGYIEGTVSMQFVLLWLSRAWLSFSYIQTPPHLFPTLVQTSVTFPKGGSAPPPHMEFSTLQPIKLSSSQWELFFPCTLIYFL